MNIMDKLFERCQRRLPFCVGLDTASDYLPPELLTRHDSSAAAIVEFNQKIIDSTYDIAAAYKVQIAYYEAMGLAGMQAYADTLAYLRSKDAIIIADVKRSDIAATAKEYAKAHFSGDFEADIITLNPYMGFDSLQEYLPYLSRGKGAFVLLQTSNPGWRDIQAITDNQGVMVCRVVGKRLLDINRDLAVAGCGAIGVVIGCTDLLAAELWREQLGNMLTLIPGYGAQGGSAEVVRALLGAERRGVVNLSRALLLAWKKNDNNDFAVAARQELLRLAEEAGYVC